MQQFEKHFRDSMKSNIPLLNIITNYLLRRKGKQIRPMFVFLTAGLCGDITPSSYNAASLIELLHSASLIHDDVVDESYERRGFFSINALWKSKVSVLLGDYLLAKGLLLSVKEKEHELLRLVSDAVREMSEGELMQIQKSRKLNITKEEYFEIIRKKTAALIAACTACGAWSASQDNELTEKFRVFGEKVGMAFQIKDDLFDYQQKGFIGKPTGNDIKEKKFTLPLIHALEVCPEKERKHIIRIIRRHNNNASKVQEVIAFARSYEGLEYSEKLMLDYRDEAIGILAEMPDNQHSKSLQDLVNYVVVRKK
ncbi:MAG: polyprenyl synthetase family protein [Bacteroidales bacterium]